MSPDQARSFGYFVLIIGLGVSTPSSANSALLAVVSLTVGLIGFVGFYRDVKRGAQLFTFQFLPEPLFFSWIMTRLCGICFVIQIVTQLFLVGVHLINALQIPMPVRG